MPQQRPSMGGPGDWGGPRSAGSPVGGPGHPPMGRPGMMGGGGPMMNRSNSVPPNSRSMLQQQLMDMGGTYTTPRPSPNPLPAPPTRQKQSSHFRVVLFLSRF